MLKTCPQCHIPFNAKRKKQVYCSRFCKGESQKLKIEYQCAGCGKKFWNYPYLKRKSNYCSLNCYHNFNRKKQTRTCLACGKEFKVKNYLILKGFGKFCSRKCQHALYPERFVKYCIECGKKIEVPPSKQHLVKFCSKKCQDDNMRDYETRVCKQCKKEFSLPKFKINRGGGIFCSRACFKLYTGETSIEEKIRKCLEDHHIEFKQEVKIGRFYADFLITNTPVIIECDGIYWHSLEKAKERDKRKDNFLRENGYKVFRFAEEMIRKSPLECLMQVFDFSYT